MNFIDLNDTTRLHMRSEVESDIVAQNLYLSDRLSETGQVDWPGLLLTAIDDGDDASLIAALWEADRLNYYEPYIRNGVWRTRRVPRTAAETLAEGEFNRFYIRGLCVRAVDSGIPSVEVYRAKAVSHARPESIARIGMHLDAQALLDDLRIHNHVDTALGVPAGPNSGLSVRLLAAS